MSISFSKYQATGNDFILINGIDTEISLDTNKIKELCDRQFGIGADGLIIAKPSDSADFFMDYYNSDGSVAEMCGNGIRALSAFLEQKNKAISSEIKIDTRAGVRQIELNDDLITVNMGNPSFEKADIGFDGETEMWDFPLQVNGSKLKVYGVSIGNPHCIIFTDDISKAPVNELGPKVEKHPLFKNQINVEWVEIENAKNLNVKVWERGAGYTLACGTGACASLAVANRLEKVEKQAIVSLPGGELKVEFRGSSLFLTGKAELVFEGDIDL